MIRYLTGASSKGSEAVAFERGIGLMIQPGNSYHLKVDRYPFWAADNGAFTKSAKGFDPAMADGTRRLRATALQARLTPPAFAELLVSIARSVSPK